MYFRKGKIQGGFVKKLIVCKRFKRRWCCSRNARISCHRRPNRADDGKGGNGVGKEMEGGMFRANGGIVRNYWKKRKNVVKLYYSRNQ